MDNNLQKEMFVATLVHDLKNPLLAQTSAVSQLYDEVFGPLNEQQKEILGIILESCEYMQNLISMVLETYKNENGQIKLEKKYFNPDNFLKTCLREHTSLLKDKNLDFVYENNLYEKENILYADETQLRRVVENILNNQIVYAFKNTKIIIKLFKTNKNLVFSFENSSPEIEALTKAEIFEKFKTKEITKHKLSLGLGLYLARQITQAHAGKIYLETNNTSNRFVIELPAINKQKTKITW